MLIKIELYRYEFAKNRMTEKILKLQLYSLFVAHPSKKRFLHSH